jgi:hypothetical protein
MRFFVRFFHRARGAYDALVRRLTLFSGWVWVAAISFVGIETFEVVFGMFVLAPELLPLALIALACAWYFRGALRRVTHTARVRIRLARARLRRRRRS